MPKATSPKPFRRCNVLTFCTGTIFNFATSEFLSSSVGILEAPCH